MLREAAEKLGTAHFAALWPAETALEWSCVFVKMTPVVLPFIRHQKCLFSGPRLCLPGLIFWYSVQGLCFVKNKLCTRSASLSPSVRLGQTGPTKQIRTGQSDRQQISLFTISPAERRRHKNTRQRQVQNTLRSNPISGWLSYKTQGKPHRGTEPVRYGQRRSEEETQGESGVKKGRD